MGHYQVVPLQVRMDLGVMATKKWLHIPLSSLLKMRQEKLEASVYTQLRGFKYFYLI